MKRTLISIFLLAGAFFSAIAVGKVPVTVVAPAGSQPRVLFGAEKLTDALGKAGYATNLVVGGQSKQKRNTGAIHIFLRLKPAAPGDSAVSKEAFSIVSSGHDIRIEAKGGSGLLYGCLELAERIGSEGRLPTHINVKDGPEMVLRGTCIGVQKPTLLPGRGPYEYPYTPENFPWFYDKKLWIKYLDSMVNNRLNSLYLWNGHPFASLVRVAEYPYAVEVDDATFKKNEEMYRFLTTEADKRGIWVIQMFYNIIVSKPFAEKNHLKTQDRNRHIIPIIADYTRKSIAAFVKKYPNVGLMMTLGEAMEGVGQDDIDWFTGTILPGIKDGLKALGRKDEVPVVLRAHDTDAPSVMKAALPLYKNLYVMAKYNGEALTTYTPHGPWAELHRKLSHVAVALIENVHIMANLEPFRYGSADFIQKCVQAMHSVYGANGLHVYPQASYWDWPYSADRTQPRTLEMERDWIWYKEWARYAWNCHRSRKEEVSYWSRQLASRYGCDERSGRDILEAYEQAGEIAPKLLRRFGITDGNRQTLTLGMLMTQLIDPQRYGLFTLLYESEGPPGEMLGQYAEKEWKRLPHEGETPVDVIRDVQEEGKLATEAIEKAAVSVGADTAEFNRLRNDMFCYKALADCYAAKAGAALSVLRYKYSHDIRDLEKALPLLESSLKSFEELTALAGAGYRYANSMQTPQRKIPVRGAGGKFITWKELLPFYERELENFKGHLDSLRSLPAGNNIAKTGEAGQPGQTTRQGHTEQTAQPVQAPAYFVPARVRLTSQAEGYYTPEKGARPYTDSSLTIRSGSPAFKDIKGIRQSAAQQRKEGTHIGFTCTEPVDLLIGFFDQKGQAYLLPSQLETDASANDYGQADVRMRDVVEMEGLPPVNLHSWSFKPGTHTLDLGKGLCLVLGFVQPKAGSKIYDAGGHKPDKAELDWLFE